MDDNRDRYYTSSQWRAACQEGEKRCDEARAELERTKAELATATSDLRRLQDQVDKLSSEHIDNARMEAENAKLRVAGEALAASVDSMNGWTTDDENAREAWRAAVGGGEESDASV